LQISEVPKPNKPQQNTAAQASGVLSLINNLVTLFNGPLAVGIAALGSALSQNIPSISAYGGFGVIVVGLLLFLVAAAASALWMYVAGRLNERRPAKKKGATNKLVWCVALACVGLGIFFYRHAPPLPPGIPETVLELPMATYRELRQNKIVGRTVVLNQLPQEPGRATTIQNKAFENCILLGPAVITLPSNNVVRQCRFDSLRPGGTIDDMLLVSHGEKMVGMLGFYDCRFEMSTFVGVSFASSREGADMIKRSLLNQGRR
jgi:type IV secretory pathway VirB2 component (pilin)